MKKKLGLNQKLSLNKTTISQLTPDSQAAAMGGAPNTRIECTVSIGNTFCNCPISQGGECSYGSVCCPISAQGNCGTF